MMLVMFVLIVVSSIGINAFVSVEKQHLKKVTVELRDEIRAMQRLSMSERRQYNLDFLFGEDSECNQYEISYFDEKEQCWVRVKSVTFPKGIRLVFTNTPKGTLRYTTRGTIASGACTIVLGSENYKIAITLNVGVGRTSTKEIISADEFFPAEERQ